MTLKEAIEKNKNSQKKKSSTSTTSSKNNTSASGTTGSGSSGLTLREAIQRNQEKTATSSLQGWADSGINLIKDLQNNSSNWYDDNQYKSWEERFTSLLGQADSWRKQYAGNKEAVSYIDSLVEELIKAKSYSYNTRQYYSQWDNADAYNSWYQKESFISEYLNDPQKAVSTMDYQTDWLKEAEARAEKNRILSSEDFAAHSQYASTKADDWWSKMWSQYGLGYGDLTYEYINNQNGLRDEISGKSRAYRSDTKDRESSFEENHYDYMTDDEVSIYNYYYSKFGKEKAEEYLYSIGGTLEARANNQTVKNVSKFAGEHPWISSALSVGTSVLSGQEYVEDVIEYGKDKVLGKPARLGTNEAALMTNAVRGTVSDMVDWEIGNWDAFDFLYSTAMSGVDSLVAGTMFGNFGGVVLGLSAAAQGTNDALARGMSNGQAFWNGLFSGVFECIFETISIGQFNKLKEIAPESIKEIIKNLGKSMLVNASEEALTEVANIAYDTLVNGEFANYTVEDLKSGAWKDALLQVIEAGASGALMGVGMSGIGNTVGYYNGSKSAKQTYGGSQQELVGESLEINPGNTFAQRMQTKLDLGKNLSGGQLNRLVQQNVKAITAQDISTIQNAAESRLSELGETGDVGIIAAALAKQAAGQKLTRAEQQAIAGSKYGQRVANELNPENINSGDYSSEWAQKLDTNRINIEEYSRLVEGTQMPQETVETTGGQIATDVPKAAQAAQVAPEVATVRENRTVSKEEMVPANDQQMTGKLTGKESLQAAEESSEIEEAEAKTITLEDASKKYGAQAKAMIHTYQAGQDVAKFDKAYQAAYDMGKSGVSASYTMSSPSVSYLTDTQKELAYEAGVAASNTAAKELDNQNKAAANGKTGRKKGAVRGEGVTIADLKKTFNDTQGKAYKYLSTVAEVTGIDIVLYRSEAGSDGKFQGAQGRYSRSEPGTIYIDLNAGLSDIKSADDLAKYAMLRTFAHEFTHFIEKWNPIQYNEFRKVVFDTLTQRGENVHDLIEDKQAHNPGMSYDKASREVVAEAMTDILPDVNFVQELAENHKTIFQKLLDQLKEFVENLRVYFNSIGHNRSKEANALKEQVGETLKYLDSIVKLFDNVAAQAVENYQQTVAEDVVVAEKENTTAEATTEEATPVVEKDAYGFTISDNVEHGSLEITFDSKPSDEVRHVLKENKFRWHKVKKVWFGYTDRQTITDALHAAYEAEAKPAESVIEHRTPAEPEPVAQKPEPAAEPEYDPSDPYVRLAGLMGNRARFEHEGFIYRVLKAGPDNSMWQGRIDAADVSAGGVYVTNARGIHYASELYENRDDARDDIIAVARASKLLDEKPTETTKPKEEVITNGTEETGTVLPHRSDGQGDPRLLAEVETGAVPGTESAGDPVDGSGERGNETGRHDLGADAERHERGHGEGSSQSGDLRGTDRVTEESVTDNKVGDKSATTGEDTNVPSNEAEKLHEEVTEQIAQQSTEKPKGRNFVIGDSLDLPNGEKARYKANIDAIRLVKQLEAEGRYATEAEQVILSKYVGWGGLANAFSDKKADWAKEYAELKELLTDEEYSSARGSTLNAHYTDISVIKAMYAGLQQLGFTGGRMMEPSSGVGNFVGAMPADMSAKVRSWTMVELDGITGLIAKYLYPNADVRIQGFEKANIPNNFMDVAISNVPFGNYAIADKTYPKKVTGAIHNYFFAKSLDKVRPGGIVMFITSSYTMNSKDSTVRRYIMQKADLLGAIRLPDSAFKGNAGTEVVTDILILKKRAANTAYAGEDFLEAPYRYISGYNGAYVNSYFDNHPEMVLGTATMSGSMYRGDSLTYKALEGKGSLADQIREAFKNIQGKMDYPAQQSPEKVNFAVERADKKTKLNGYVAKDGKIYQNKDGELVEVNASNGTAERITGLLEIRDAAKELQSAQQQGLKDTEIKKARQKLNKAYDAFVKKHGFINSQANRNAIKDDPDKFSIFALENYNPETKKGTKADIFSKNTIAPNRTVTTAKDVAEGLIVSINQTGGVDAALIAKLTGKTEAEVTRELIDSRKVFKNRDGGLETAEVYLSGNVRAKLRDAEALVSLDSDYQKNVDALKTVMPEDVGYQDIFVNPGTPWIPDTVYSDFAAHMLGTANHEWSPAIAVTRNKDTGNFVVELKNKYLKSNSYNTQKWGTNRRSFLDLFDAMLNSKSVVVKYKTDDGKSVIDQDATAAANEKVEAIQKEFQEWLWKDESRRTDLAVLYNETFNSIVTPKYNGDNLTVNGANAMKPLRPHQRNAVQRVIASGGNTLLAHKVGAGKTYEMAAAAMKLKQLGLVKKPLFAVPKSLVAQWGNEFMDFFPTAKLLVAEAGDFTATNRKIFANRIANGDYDAVIVSYEQFEKLPISADFARELYQEQIDSIILAIEEAKAEKGGKSLSVKDLEKKRKSLQTKIEKLTDSAKDEDNIEFEQLGVDSIFVDEAHNFKNLFYTTSMTNVSGLGNKDGSKRAFDLYTKVRYLQKLNGGRGIVFATATPVMNSMSEMYIMQKYLQPDLLEQLGLSTFDAWAKQFGEVVNGVEIKPSGQGYRVKQSFSRFKNMSELQLLFRNFADVLTDIPGLKIPKMKGGKVNVVVCEPGQFQQDYMKELEKRADNIKNVDPSVDNMLKITSDGRKISYTQRMIDPSLPYEEGCKIYRCADNVVRVYKDSESVKGTQLIFCDMATPKGKSKATDTQTEEIETDMESARLYDDIKARLMKGGIPAKEIAFIHEADTDAKKKKLFADVNDGKVRVLIGSTGKMGVGMNAQKRIVAIHHLDAPWRPGDVEQRNGRAYRQGNINDEVENFTYVTEGSFDARLWDILDRKQNFINQVMNGENVGRETEDTGEVTLSAAEVKALASGSPLIMEQVQLDTDIKKLESLRRAHRSAITNAMSRLEADRGRIPTLEKMIANAKLDAAARVDTYSEGKFSITIGNQKFTEKKDAGIALMAEATAKANEDGYTTIAKFAGFDLRVIAAHDGIKGLISGKQGYYFNTYPGNTTYMINHLIAKVEEISEAIGQWEQDLAQTRKDMVEQEQLIKQPFAKQAELDQKRARYNEIMEILNPKEEQALDSVAEDVQEQSRSYLEEDKEPAPVFYSQMAKVLDGVKQEKLGAASVVNMLRGKGVKAEEIKWSGIETFLEGKKSVTKAELQEFINGSMLQIEEQVRDEKTGRTVKMRRMSKDTKGLYVDGKLVETFTEDNSGRLIPKSDPTNWYGSESWIIEEYEDLHGKTYKHADHKLKGGKNYREILFKLPGATYSNGAMQVHWGENTKGVLAHARLQDFKVRGQKMLFIEEIQSDWHNEGHREGYITKGQVTESDIRNKSADAYREFYQSDTMRSVENRLLRSEYAGNVTNLISDLFDGNKAAYSDVAYYGNLSTKEKAFIDNAVSEERKRQTALENAKPAKGVPDAPFRDNYHEFVLKRIIREAAEKGYDSIGWTTADIQSDRWSADYAEGYRIEYDQDIPKFLSKYGKKWGSQVGKSQIGDDTIWVMNITDSMRESVIYQGQTQFQQRTDTLTDREVLAMAASQVKVSDLTAAEKDALDIFQKRLSKLETLQAERAEQGRQYKEQQFGAKVDRAKAAETLNRMHELDEQIQKASADVLSVEEKTVLKRVLQKARTVVEQQEREHGQEILKRWRDRRNNADAIKKYRDRLRGDVDELTNWVLHPDNKNVVKHIPDALKNTVLPFLSSINFMSKRQLKGGNATAADKAFMEQLRRLAKVMENTVDIDEMYSNYNDLPPDFMKNLRRFIDTAQDIVDKNSGEFIINQMTSDELRELSKVVRTLKKYIMQMNRFHVNSMFQHVYEAGENSIDFLKELKPAEDTGSVSQFLLWQQMRPAYAFERFGEGGMAIYDGLRRGQATLAFNTKKIQAFAEKAYTTAEVRAWEKQVKTIRIGPGKTVTMRVSQIMSLYELNKREQAQGHIFGEGIRVATFTNGRKKISDVGQTLTPGELNLILRELTPRQKEVADSLQKFMQEQGGAWGNYVTVARFGEKQFGEENYFPINSDGRHLSVDADEKPGAAALYALLNMGFTKQTQEKAKNRLIVYSIFDVFANHMASMAQYNAFALPVVDALKWFNYQRMSEPDESGYRAILGSVREQMDRAFGVPEENRPGSGRRGYAQNFVINIIKAFNGTEAQGTPYDSWGMQTLHHYNRAQVAYNFRVVVQQPLAITRAAMLLDYASIIKGMKISPAAIQRNIAEMQQYSGIAAWKSLGFYDVNISRGLTSLIKHDDTVGDKITDVGMWGAEKADTLTWAGIWSACKEEVIRKQKLTPKSEGFFEAVTKLFEDVIYKTQVVDSVLTKNEFMRDKGFFARAVGSFMSEPTTTASMLVDAYDKYHMDMQRGMTRQQAWKKNKRMIVRTAYVYGIGAAVLAAVQAVADAFRDDDDYQEFMEKWLEAFGGNLVDEVMPFNKLPIVSDFYELAKELLSKLGIDTYGNPPQSVFMQWYDSLVKGVEILYDRISGEDTSYTWYGGVYKLLQAVSGITGLPMAGATREIVTAWNNTVGAMAPSLKVKTYEPSEKAQIKYAYEDGYLTAEEAAEQLLQQGLVDTENEAYWTVQGWEAGEGYSRYDAIFDVVRNGGDFNGAMGELISHGYTENDVLSQIKSKVGEWYKNGEISKQQAINALTKYMDMDSEDITATVNQWSSVVVTGIAFDDIKAEYLSGNITAERAIDMYVRYGGYSQDKATELVTKWRAEKETGIVYDDIDDAFMNGKITEGDARNMYITYGGYSKTEAAEKVAVLAFVKKHPDCDGISYAAIENYQTHCEASGVPAATFYDAWKYNSNTHADVDANGESISGSKKVKVLAYIDALNLTYAQKDSLYYAFGWAESKIHEAPWH